MVVVVVEVLLVVVVVIGGIVVVVVVVELLVEVVVVDVLVLVDEVVVVVQLSEIANSRVLSHAPNDEISMEVAESSNVNSMPFNNSVRETLYEYVPTSLVTVKSGPKSIPNPLFNITNTFILQ